jgi:hypothetical protein
MTCYGMINFNLLYFIKNFIDFVEKSMIKTNRFFAPTARPLI